MPDPTTQAAASVGGPSAEDTPALPPAGFDPVHNPHDEARLAEFWLPPRPDATQDPVFHELWRDLFAAPTTFVRARSRLAGSADTNPPGVMGASAFPHAVRLPETSQNWSGCYVVPNHGQRFAEVAGRWHVPNVTRGDGPATPDLPYRCSIWVGLDGKYRWAGSMPQIGSEHTVLAAGHPQADVLWWQWWVRGGNTLPNYIDGIAIHPGDSVLCWLRMTAAARTVLHVKNLRTGDCATIGVTGDVPVTGSTAEWIVERPANPHVVDGTVQTGPLHPLPDFGTVALDGFAARGVSSAGSRTYVAPGARVISITEQRNNPSRSAITSRPRRNSANGGAVSVAYQHRP